MRGATLLIAVAALLLAATPAQAARFLTKQQRADIVRTAKVKTADGIVVRHARCLGGIVSTRDGRFAAVWLANTSDCVKRYGAPAATSGLYRRPSRRSRRWRYSGHQISDRCKRVKGVPAAVLHDLGCTRIRG